MAEKKVAARLASRSRAGDASQGGTSARGLDSRSLCTLGDASVMKVRGAAT